ncbi:sensor histidine kinase [Leptothoe kymatousa]|uniref:histidine kinase n=1 Tax=Leptothoe kymatousa TAU-MAC 1615 TaxID=2364775 RepID=A0ABS5Y523_9CYAN|nr:ATP-binding protein [Leptothoe kymatousa]MBT9312934.1 hypothetical protein [Leptothoe kymatousa TAU-MAC 1615]
MAFIRCLSKKVVACLPVLLLAFGAEPRGGGATTQPPNNILVIHSYDLDLSWTEQEKRGIEEGFQDSQHSVTVYHEFLDAKRYPDLRHHDDFLSYLQTKYQHTELRLLMVADDPGLNLILETRGQYFPDIPVVFMGINHVQERLLTTPWLTGVFELHSYKETILEAQRQTQADNLIVLIDSTETGKANLERLRQLQAADGTLPQLTVVKDLTPATITQTLGQYPSHWPILLRGQLRSEDENGALIPFEDTARLLRSQVENPIYTVSSHELSHGVVGGKVLEGSSHAKQAVKLANKILAGTPVDQVEPVVEAKNQWMFDAQELKRFNIHPNALPLASTLINQKLSFYEQYRQLTWYVFSIFVLGMVTIVVLIEAIRRQKQAERTLEGRVAERTNELTNALQELKQTQAQLIQTEKLSSLGQLVGGIAHEFNNPLTFISSNMQVLQEYGQDLFNLLHLYQQQISPLNGASALGQQAENIDLDYIQADMPKIFRSVAKGTERIESIVRSLQSFACSDEQGVKPTNLNDNLDNTLLILKSRIDNDVELVKEYGPLPLVDCDPSAINQVFMQVLLNAIDAVNSLGDGSVKQIVIHSCLQEDDWVTIAISDSGPGILPSLRDKVFDPFFTTKPVGKGVGLGLSVSYQYLQQHHGHLALQPHLPQGTTCLIQLPITQARSSVWAAQAST